MDGEVCVGEYRGVGGIGGCRPAAYARRHTMVDGRKGGMSRECVSSGYELSLRGTG